MKVRHFSFFLISLAILTPILVITVLAHPGRTDSNGGHTNHSTGEYHYHHGYSAHDHYDTDNDGNLDCPYDFVNNSTTSISSTAPAPSSTFGEWFLIIPLISVVFIMGMIIRKKNIIISNLQKQLSLQHEDHAKLKSDLAKLNFLAIKTAPSENIESIQRFCKTYGTETIDIPYDVFFLDGFIPVKGIINKDKPYGDFTVYVTETGTRYHINRYCNRTSLRAIHIFDTNYRYSPCAKCASGSSNITPEWYKEIKRITNNN